jgi:hypothetical protein
MTAAFIVIGQNFRMKSAANFTSCPTASFLPSPANYQTRNKFSHSFNTQNHENL